MFHFYVPHENFRRPSVFRRFQGVQKLNIEPKSVKTTKLIEYTEKVTMT